MGFALDRRGKGQAMNGPRQPPCSIIVNVRDKFSTTTRCLTELIRQTDPSVPITAVIGGAPEELRTAWDQTFAERVEFVHHDRFISQAEARNGALANVSTALAVVMDNDVYVRSGWLEALLECQRTTEAVMVVPLVLEEERRIHCAGNSLYVNYEGTTPYGHKVLPLTGYTYGNGCNLERSKVDYGELHLQLIQVEPTLRLGAYDERIIEVGEVDSGLTWRGAGHEMYFEPRSVVQFDLTHPVEWCDVDVFAWRWDMRTIADGYDVFKQKWGLDITEQGRFEQFLIDYNSKLPLLPRWLGTKGSYDFSRRLSSTRASVRALARSAKRRLRARAYHEDSRSWPVPSSYEQRGGPTPAPFVRAWAPDDRSATAPQWVSAT